MTPRPPRFGATGRRLEAPDRVNGSAGEPPSVAGSATQNSHHSGSAPLRLVLGDEHRLFVDALGMALAARGYQVVATATTCVGLLRAVLVHRPDACLLDLGLLDRDAIDMIDRLRTQLPHVKVLLLSTDGDGDSCAAAAAVKAGTAGHLSKDQGIDVIDQALERLRGGGSPSGGGLTQNGTGRLGGNRKRGHQNPQDRALRLLTHREREVLRRLTEGESTSDIARALSVTTNTARTHVQNVLDKLGVHSRLEAVALAHRAGTADSRTATTAST